ncbi:MFS transporter [Paraburkholderia caballeronis]|uniref:MFS transporter, AAHS family, 4-hydroxybenzoate transporter n=1 Tax=Paraburkholderia caballeronis TaxID=416943 RepID=A0A1H7P1W4_9BURK|nr:aromatic acid/H+ symport family MFS transporter [Paraburkholderia caballeronis]PXW25421.1 AAHS family 4-hydroxybenzoate transporter-like MFS transporter [Paraburkholderia caballeronis]PXX01028.1 AAHS family 4-hydroxybenzoate transporter-like MFS transporter [Paraburkholderia caballeronis]RAJ99619.1 AAHS family 4-hydroxybenzoate transporter-like MFS transporter [Paraburkholderia caballeronis]SEE38141.1 MFS transporter, AAHS family, 4-hydroxybenzoate transporter [Paraburkholderia caballeronis]
MATAPRTLDVQQFIDERRFSPYQWFILALCFLIVATDGFDTAAIGFVAPSLGQEWHVGKAALGPVMSAALVGLAIGALASGPLADRIGRKRVLVGSVVTFALFSVGCAFASSVTELGLLRLATGIGLGAAMPNATTLMSEYAPARKRSFLVNTMFCGFTVGSSAGGLVAAALIPGYGWRSVFIAGGVLPLVLSVVLIGLPESLRFMVLRGWPAERIAAVLRRIAPRESFDGARFALPEEPSLQKQSGASIVLSSRFRSGTLLLWITYFSGLLVYYLLTSWLPTLIRDTGFTVREAALVTALFPLGGGIGAIGVGWLMDRFEPHRVIAVTYVLTGIFVWLVGRQSDSLAWLAAITFVAGVCMNGAQSSLPTLAAAFYPTSGRATGVAWMLGVGRFGGIFGAFSGGLLLQANFGFGTIFAMLAAPSLVAAGALLAKRAVSLRDAREPDARGVA